MKTNKILIGTVFLVGGYLLINYFSKQKLPTKDPILPKFTPKDTENITLANGEKIKWTLADRQKSYDDLKALMDGSLYSLPLDFTNLKLDDIKVNGISLSEISVTPNYNIEMPNAEEFANMKFPPLLSLDEFSRQLNMPSPPVVTY